MPEATRMDNRTLLRRTLLTVGAMVGGCVFIVATLTLVALGVVGHSVGSREVADAGGAATQTPATALHPGPAGPKPGTTSTAIQRH
jgi:hypothetical protein